MFITMNELAKASAAVQNYAYNDAKLACNEQAPVQAAPKDKGNKPMCYDCDCVEQENIDVTKNDHAENRINSIYHEKRRALRVQFNVDQPKAPTTGQELIDAITSGNYSLKAEKDIAYWDRYHPMMWFNWSKPDVKPDTKTFDLAVKALESFRDSQLDTAVLGDDAAKLAAIKAMQDWTYTA